MARLPLATYEKCIEPLLHFLAAQTEPVRARDAYEAVADAMGIDEEAKALLLPSRSQAIYKNRIGWAHDRLKRAGYSESPRRGYWLLTEAGREFSKANPVLSEAQVDAIAKVEVGSTASSAAGTDAAIAETSTQSPEEQIESGLEELRSSVAQDLLELIGRSTPLFFERLVLHVLHKMGYGADRDSLQHTGKSSDGGIDGIISLDRLGLEKVYVQAKKWKGQVGSPEIQGFMGALQLQGADKGVLITSGTISGPAIDAAKQARGSVVLIDGQRLARLMIDHGVGVGTKTVEIPTVDNDYFEDD